MSYSCLAHPAAPSAPPTRQYQAHRLEQQHDAAADGWLVGEQASAVGRNIIDVQRRQLDLVAVAGVPEEGGGRGLAGNYQEPAVRGRPGGVARQLVHVGPHGLPLREAEQDRRVRVLAIVEGEARQTNAARRRRHVHDCYQEQLNPMDVLLQKKIMMRLKTINRIPTASK